MDELIDLIKQLNSKEDDGIAINKLIKQFEPKIRRSLHEIDALDREDLAQEIKLTLIEFIYKFNAEDVPNFEQFIIDINERQCKQLHF
ncbi:helix-turn-helix domain-containing protein [Amphibacillus jilinensis]|uniref:helix-turn-helix domain-containing protein n=1 Tax=Amphibacillus jilinensis TaxID=1216008 RepID=UPI00030833B4|nr:helix-turn-helix domain-containing protein [Amphibacillus jilinensis]